MTLKANHQRDKADLFQSLWVMLAPPGLAMPEREVLFAKSLGRKWRADFLWTTPKLIVEVDGGQWVARGGRHNTDSDRLKTNTAAVLGYRVLHFTPDMLRDDPHTCIEMVVSILNPEINT